MGHCFTLNILFIQQRQEMMSPGDQRSIQHTMQWVQSFVIGLNLCPFAKREVDRGSVRIQISSADTVEQALLDLMIEVELLNTKPSISTTLLVFPHFLTDFFDYLDCVDCAEALLVDAGYEGIYQLATFHPNYCFAGAAENDVTNYTNRSPYPMLHLLREEQVAEAIAYYGNTDTIPEDNMTCLRNLGLDAVKKMSA